MTGITATLHEDQHTFMITSRSVLFTMTNVSDKTYRENENTICIQYIFFPEGRSVY